MKTGLVGPKAMVFLFAGLISLSFFSFPAEAQIPRTISYQGYLTNAQGAPIDSTVNMTFAIYDILSGGTPLWQETQSNVLVIGGVYNVSLGGVTPLGLSFDAPYFLEIAIGGETLSPRKAITSVGYAFRAYTVEVVPTHTHSGADINDGTVAEPRIDAAIARTSALTGHTSDTSNPHATTAAQVGAAAAGHAHSGADITSGTVAEPRIDAAIARDSEVASSISSHTANPSAHHTRYTNAEAVAAILASDGSGSGLNADLLDGQDASAFASSTHNHNADYVNVAGDTMTGALIINRGAASGAAATIQITTPTNTSPAIEAASSGEGAAVRGTNGGFNGPAGYFQITNSNSAAHALHVQTNGTGYGHGIFSYSTGLSRAGFFEINNASNGGEAIIARTNGTGQAFHGTTTGTSNAGFFDITNASNSAEALYVATNGTGRSGYFQISNVSSGSDVLYATTNGTGNAIKGYTTGSGYSGFFQGGAGLYVAGNLNVTGNLTKGSGSFVQPYKKDPSKEIVYAFFEGPEHAIFLRGKAKLVDGRAVIETPEYFRDVAGSDEDITVQFTPRSSRSKGLAAVEVTKDSIKVEELIEGKGTYEFDYFITAKRAGFEGHKPVQKNTHFSAHNETQEEFERRYADTSDMTVRAMRDMLIASGILTKDGRLNRDVAERLGWKVKDQEFALK